MRCVFAVNTTINLPNGERIWFPFETDEATSVEAFSARIAEYGHIFGYQLRLRRDLDNNDQVIIGRTATMLTPGGLSMVQDWTRGKIVDETEP